MALVSSIRHHAITNEFNDGANNLKQFLHYAESVSKGDANTARRVLENLNPLSRRALAPSSKGDAVVEGLAEALRSRGFSVELNVGQSKFRCDLAVRNSPDGLHQLGILVDTDGHYANSNLLDRYLMQPSILRAFGWLFTLVLTKDWYHNPDEVLNRIEKMLQGEDETEESEPQAEEPVERPAPEVATLSEVTTSGLSPGSEADSKAATEAVVNPEPDAVPVSASASNPARHFEFVGGSSRKFWEITVSGNSFAVRFGRIGTPGQSQTKTFADEAKAQSEAGHMIAEKVKKGYLEKFK